MTPSSLSRPLIMPPQLPAGGSSHLFPWMVAALGLFCGILFFVHPMMSLGILIGFTGLLIGMRRPLLCWKVSLLCALVLQIFLPAGMELVFTWGVLLTSVVGAWAELKANRQPIEIVSGKLWIAIGLWLLWAFITVFFSFSVKESVKELFRYSFSFFVFFTYLNWLREETLVKKMTRWLEIVLGVATCFFLIEGTLRMMGTSLSFVKDYSGQMTQLSATLAGSIPIFLSLLIANLKPFPWKRAAYLLLLELELLMTLSRASFLAASLGSLIVLWDILKPSVKRKIIGMLLIAGLLLLIGLGLYYGNPFSGAVRNLSGRNLLWQVAIQAMMDHPLTGFGPGAWKAWVSDHYLGVDFLLYDTRGNTFALPPSIMSGEGHNLFLTKGAEMGFPSVLFIFLMFNSWFQTARHFLPIIKKFGDAKWLYPLCRGCYGAMIALSVRCIFENGPIIGRGRGPEVFFVWFVAAIPLALGKILEKKHGGAS